MKITVFKQSLIELCNLLNSPNIYMKNKLEVLQKIISFTIGGPEKLQVLLDYDYTITKQHRNGQPGETSYGMLYECPSIPEDANLKNKELYEQYSSKITDPNLTDEEKEKYINEWWTKAENLLTGLTLRREEFDEVAKKSSIQLRDDAREFFEDTCKANVPVLIFSAGIGDVTRAVLKNKNLLLPNVKIVSNFLRINKGNKVEGYEAETVTPLNKKWKILKERGFEEGLQGQNNIILMGDICEDAGMDEGAPESTTLKIGFLYQTKGVTEKHILQYKDAFDIVLVDDQSFRVVNFIYKLVNM